VVHHEPEKFPDPRPSIRGSPQASSGLWCCWGTATGQLQLKRGNSEAPAPCDLANERRRVSGTAKAEGGGGGDYITARLNHCSFTPSISGAVRHGSAGQFGWMNKACFGTALRCPLSRARRRPGLRVPTRLRGGSG
jgi:hypothetical protein